MKKTAIIRLIVILFTIHCSLITSKAQTLTVTTSSGSTQVSASEAGTMTYNSSAGTLTIGGTAYNVNDITKMVITEASSSTVDGEATVNVVYNGSSATVTTSSDIANYVTVTQSGAHVSIVQSSSLATEITYNLSGSSTDGEFYMEGSYKATLVLNGLTLTNKTPVYSGAAIDIQNGKRINIKLTEGTTSTLADASSGSQKGCLYVKGHAEFKQKGTLNVVGNVKHAIKTGDYFTLKNATINVTSAVGDGINCNEYFLMESGTINISGTSDDGIQCDLDGDSSTGETTGHEDEDSGNIYIAGGTITVNCPSKDSEGIQCEGAINITDGHVTVNAYDDAINSGGDLTISGGYVFACATNNDGIDANGNCYIKGGIVYAVGSGAPEVAIDANSEKQKKLYIMGGTLVAVGGLESGASISGGTCMYTTSWTGGSWYALYNGSDLALAFKTPASSSSGMSGGPGGGGFGGPGGPGGPGGGGSSQQLVVYTSSTPSLQSGVTVSGGKEYFSGMANVDGTVSGGSTVTLSNYSGGNSGPGWH